MVQHYYKEGFLTVPSVNLQVFSDIIFAANLQQSHGMIDTLHSIMDNKAAQGNMSEAKQKISPLLTHYSHSLTVYLTRKCQKQ